MAGASPKALPKKVLGRKPAVTRKPKAARNEPIALAFASRSEVSHSSPRGGDPHFISAVARGFQVLRCFNATRRELGTTEIAALTGLPQPTAWRLCHTLVELGYLAPVATGEKLRIAAGILGLGQTALAGPAVVDAIRIEMQEVADATSTAVSFSIHDNAEMRILARVHSSGTLLFNFSPGSTLPLANSASGWAVMATLPEPEYSSVHAYLAKKHGRAWPSIWAHIDSETAKLTSQGYVVSRGAIHPDMLGIAIPILASGVMYTISAGAALKDTDDHRVHRVLAPRLQRLAKTAAAALQGEMPFLHKR